MSEQLTCSYCTSAKSFSSQSNLLRHQSQSEYCRNRKQAVALEQLAERGPLRTVSYSDDESDPEQNEYDGYGEIYASTPLPDSYFDVPFSPPAEPRNLQTPVPSAAATSEEGTNSSEELGVGLPEEPDDESYVQLFPFSGKVFSSVAPPIATLFANVQRDDNPFAPFQSQEDYELAHWAKMNGVTEAAFNRLLDVPRVTEGMTLSYKNSREMNSLLDTLPLPARFSHTSISVAGTEDTYDLFFCNTLEIVGELMADPTFADFMTWQAERCYSDPQGKNRVWSELTSSDWMWEAQGKIAVGGTVIPILLSTDKTQLTAFSGDHVAYPVYLSIGNIAKHVRRQTSQRAFRLVGYLPTLKPDETAMSEEQARRIRFELFHKAMEIICEPLFKAAMDGAMLPDSKGDVRRCFPILASYIADYPEQCLVTCVRSGQTCPKCDISVDLFGSHRTGAARQQSQTLNTILKARAAPTAAERDNILDDANVNNITPFWARWRHVNIHDCITADVLHQNIQGVGAHLVEWVTHIVGEKELDARIARLPPAHGLRSFVRGISVLSRVTGSERKDIYAQLLGAVVGRVSRDALRAARALLDCIYITQFECHSEETLKRLKDALDEFHKYKGSFKRAKPDINFNFPKMHMLEHYEPGIRRVGTTDNCNTESTERLHIELSKLAFKATNRRDYIVQMCFWITRRQALHLYAVYRAWKRGERYDARLRKPRKPAPGPVFLAKRPPARVLIDAFERQHNFTNFKPLLNKFLQAWYGVAHRFYDAELPPSVAQALDTLKAVDVWYQVKFLTPDLQTFYAPDVLDIAHASPLRMSRSKNVVFPRFDPVLVETKGNGVAGTSGLKDIRIARLRAIFQPPAHAAKQLFGTDPPDHLAVVEWFSRPSRRDAYSGMHHITRTRTADGQREFGIIEVIDLRRSCHLFPEFGKDPIDRSLTSHTVLDVFDNFLLNDRVDKHAYRTM